VEQSRRSRTGATEHFVLVFVARGVASSFVGGEIVTSAVASVIQIYWSVALWTTVLLPEGEGETKDFVEFHIKLIHIFLVERQKHVLLVGEPIERIRVLDSGAVKIEGKFLRDVSSGARCGLVLVRSIVVVLLYWVPPLIDLH